MMINKTFSISVRVVFFAAMLLSLSGCFSSYPNQPFSLMDEASPVKPTSIAVIAGSPSQGTMQLAEFITQGLSEKSSFKVLSQKAIKKRVRGYPMEIMTKDKKVLNKEEDDLKQVWFPPSSMATFEKLQKKLNVDYLYVVWIPWMNAVTNGRAQTTYQAWPSGNMIEFPSGRVVATTKIFRSETDSPLALFRSNNYYIVKILQDSANDIVDELIRISKEGKPS